MNTCMFEQGGLNPMLASIMTGNIEMVKYLDEHGCGEQFSYRTEVRGCLFLIPVGILHQQVCKLFKAHFKSV